MLSKVGQQKKIFFLVTVGHSGGSTFCSLQFILTIVLLDSEECLVIAGLRLAGLKSRPHAGPYAYPATLDVTIDSTRNKGSHVRQTWRRISPPQSNKLRRKVGHIWTEFFVVVSDGFTTRSFGTYYRLLKLLNSCREL